jgi:imidazolonepropionase-like amidohydrolase
VSQPPSGSTIITAARVWDGVAPGPIGEGFVAVENGSITAIGRVADLGSIAGHVLRIDLGDATLLPGLIDAHVHLALSGSSAPVEDYRSEEAEHALTARALRNLDLAVKAGVTTVRDLGCPNEVAFAVRGSVAGGRVVGPRVLTSGCPITVTGGHCHWFSHECDSEAQVRVATRLQAGHGADLVKIFVNGGHLTPGTDPLVPVYSAAEVAACVEEAMRAGLQVAAHAYDPEGIRRAVVAGVSTVEHCLFETADAVAYDPVIGERMAEQRIAFVPTIADAMTTASSDAPPIRLPRRFRAKLPMIGDAFRRMRAAGVPLVAGSDAGVPQRDFGGLARNLAGLVDESGVDLSPREALIAATSASARHLGLLDTGVLATGYRADLIGVSGDPLRNIWNLYGPRFVMVNGRISRYSPEGLSTMIRNT